MSYVLTNKIPQSMVDVIKLYTGEAVWRNGKFIIINKISKRDYRYDVLKKRPKIKQLRFESFSKSLYGCAWFRLQNKNFVVITVGSYRIWREDGYIDDLIWMLHYDNNRIIRYL